MGPEIGYEAIGIVDSSLPTVGVYAQADKSDTPRAVSEKTGDDLRSETPQVCSSLIRNSQKIILYNPPQQTRYYVTQVF